MEATSLLFGVKRGVGTGLEPLPLTNPENWRSVLTILSSSASCLSLVFEKKIKENE